MNLHFEPYICAIDGGGTGCRVAIARTDGTIVAQTKGGAANYTTNAAETIANITETVSRAIQKMSADAPPLSTLVTHAGLAGVAKVMSDTDLRTLEAKLPFDVCTVSDDQITTTIGSLGGQDGVLFGIGTGSFATVCYKGKIDYIGGWGHQLGDQASGAWLGRAVLERSILAWDGLCPASELTDDIWKRLNHSPAQMITFAQTLNPSDFANLAPMVIYAAAKKDPVGHKLMTQASAYLDLVLRSEKVMDTMPICLTGGVGPAYAPYLAPDLQKRLRAAQGTAIDGALVLAQKLYRVVQKQGDT